MSLTVVPETPRVDGHRKKVRVNVTIGAYSTGGLALRPADCGLSAIEDVEHGRTTSGWRTDYNRSTGKLKVNRIHAIDVGEQEMPDGTDLSAETVRLLVTGW